VADFHALRHTYISRLVASGAGLKVAQELARHSTPTLTLGRYAHVQLVDQTRALDALPAIEAPRANVAALAATGTEDATAGTKDAASDPTEGRQARSALSARRRPRKSSSVIPWQEGQSEGGGGKLAESLDKVATCPPMSTSVTGAPGPIRTGNLRIRSPRTSRRKASNGADLRQAAPALSAPFQLAGETAENTPKMPPDLTQVAVAWPHVPGAVKAGILAMVTASRRR